MNFGSWIPHMFYDLIGRITPGAIILLLTFIVCQETESDGELFKDSLEKIASIMEMAKNENFPTLLVLITGLAISYITGILLNGMMYFLGKEFWYGKGENGESPFFFLQTPKISLAEADKVTSEPYMYDFILANLPGPGARLAKLSAERALGRVLMIGTFILLVFNLGKASPNSIWWFCLVEIIAIVVFGGFYFYHMQRYKKWKKQLKKNGNEGLSQSALEEEENAKEGDETNERKTSAQLNGMSSVIFNLLEKGKLWKSCLGPILGFLIIAVLCCWPVFIGDKTNNFLILHFGLIFIFFSAYAFRRHIKIRSKKLIRNNYSIAITLFEQRKRERLRRKR